MWGRGQIDKLKRLCYNGGIACIVGANRHVNLGFFLLSVRASVLFLYFYRGETLARADSLFGYSQFLAPRVKGRKKKNGREKNYEENEPE